MKTLNRSFKFVKKYSLHLNKKEIEFFHENGYLVMENFATNQQTDALRKRIYELTKGFNPEAEKSIFITSQDDDKHIKDDYFMKSGDNISYFLENDAVDKTTQKLKYPVESSLNKIGHGKIILLNF